MASGYEALCALSFSNIRAKNRDQLLEIRGWIKLLLPNHRTQQRVIGRIAVIDERIERLNEKKSSDEIERSDKKQIDALKQTITSLQKRIKEKPFSQIMFSKTMILTLCTLLIFTTIPAFGSSFSNFKSLAAINLSAIPQNTSTSVTIKEYELIIHRKLISQKVDSAEKIDLLIDDKAFNMIYNGIAIAINLLFFLISLIGYFVTKPKDQKVVQNQTQNQNQNQNQKSSGNGKGYGGSQ